MHFPSGKAELTPDSEGTLLKVAQAMKDNPDWQVRVEGFTDGAGNVASNLKLSEERAESVANWLADHGVDRSGLLLRVMEKTDQLRVMIPKPDAGRIVESSLFASTGDNRQNVDMQAADDSCDAEVARLARKGFYSTHSVRAVR